MTPGCVSVLLLLVSVGSGLAILQTPGVPPSLCEAPTCSCLSWSNLRCDCGSKPRQELVLRSKGYDYLPFSTSSIVIENCHKVIVTGGSLEDLNALRQVHFRNIASLELHEKALSWGSTEILDSYPTPGINITIENSSIPELQSFAFKGLINSVTLRRVVVHQIKPYAFSNLAGVEKIELSDCEVKSVEPQAFKKFFADHFVFEGGHIGILPSYAIIDVTVRKDMRFEGVHFGRIRSSAVRAHGPTALRIKDCEVSSMDGDAFRIDTNGPVFISDNSFWDIGAGAFAGVSLDPHFQAHAGKQELVFENNTLLRFAEGALTFNNAGLRPTIDRIVIQRACACAEIGPWTRRLVRLTESKEAVPGVGRLMWCRRGARDTVVDDYYAKQCVARGSTVYLIVSVLIVGLVLLLAFSSVVFFFYRRRAKRYINVPTNSNRHSTYSSGSNHIMVVPEGKTYRETELHVIVERAEPITEFKPRPVVPEPPPKD